MVVLSECSCLVHCVCVTRSTGCNSLSNSPSKIFKKGILSWRDPKVVTGVLIVRDIVTIVDDSFIFQKRSGFSSGCHNRQFVVEWIQYNSYFTYAVIRLDSPSRPCCSTRSRVWLQTSAHTTLTQSQAQSWQRHSIWRNLNRSVKWQVCVRMTLQT